MMTLRVKAILLSALLVLLAACGGDDSTPDATTAPTRDGPDGSVTTPLPPAPEYRQASTVITTDNVRQAELLGRLDTPGEPSTLFNFSISPDGTQIAGLNNTSLMMWDLISGERLFTTTRQGMSDIYFSPDKDEINGVNLDGAIRVFGTERGEVIDNYSALPSFNGINVYHDETGLLVLGGSDGAFKVWDTLERRSLVTVDDAHMGGINVMAFSPDSTLLATGGAEGIVKIWNWAERELLGEIDLSGLPLSRLAFAPDNARLAVGTTENVSLWRVVDVDEPEFLYTLNTGAGGSTDVLLFSPDGRFLVNGGGIPAMTVWDGETGDLLALLPDIGVERVSAVFSPDSSMLLTSVLDGPVTLWNMEAIDIEAGTIAGGELDLGTTRIFDTGWTPDGFQMLMFDTSGSVYVWGVAADAAEQ